MIASAKTVLLSQMLSDDCDEEQRALRSLETLEGITENEISQLNAIGVHTDDLAEYAVDEIYDLGKIDIEKSRLSQMIRSASALVR